MPDSVLRNENDVGAATVMLLAFLRLRGELKAGKLTGLADGDIRRQVAAKKTRSGITFSKLTPYQ